MLQGHICGKLTNFNDNIAKHGGLNGGHKLFTTIKRIADFTIDGSIL